ncbi:MAG: hypothetical protein ACE5IP_07170 [Terriglobia bacterium]
MDTQKRILALVCLLLGSLALGLVRAAEKPAPARLTYEMIFEGSAPEYIYLTVQDDRQAVYRGGKVDEPDEPDSFRVSEKVTRRLFALVAALHYFQGTDLQSPRSVARMGKKTFAYEKDGQRADVTYNFTENDTAKELQRLCEQVARGRYHLRQLQFRLIFDRLGVMDALRRFESDLNKGRLVDVEQFALILERVAGDRRLMNLAQARARELLRRIRSRHPRLQLEYTDQETGWYYRLVVEGKGAVTLQSRRFDRPPNPRSIALPVAAVRRLLELVAQANYLRGMTPSAPGQRSGYRLTYSAGAEQHQTTFLTPPTATLAEMTHIFQQVLQQEHLRGRLQAAVEENSIMLQVILQEFEQAVSRDALIAPEDFVPLLESIARGNGYHERAREQAGRLLARVRAAH